MKNIIYVFLLLFSSIMSFSQMPTNGNYSNWNWENQNQDNWRIKNGNLWEDINAPFLASTERVGQIVDVYQTSDYTKAKGWQLIWAQFDGIYPYFILYNVHKGVIRAFFYLDSQPFTHALATLSYHDVSNPGLLTFGDEYQSASDMYLNGIVNSGDDMISAIIPHVSPKTWYSADFPIVFDSNIQNSKYNSKKWVFKFYGCDNFQITLSDGSSLPNNKQHTISSKSSSISSNSFSADYAKLHENIESGEKLLEKIKKTTTLINDNSPSFLKEYKQLVTGLNTLFTKSVPVSSFILGFVKFVNGTFNEEKSTIPNTVVQYKETKGKMDIKYSLGGNTLKIPGVNGSFFPNVNWSPYNCAMGYFNLEKTPIIRKTSSYDKYAFDDSEGYMSFDKNGQPTQIYNLLNYPILLAQGNHAPYPGQYLGKFIKYKFEDDNILSINDIPGLNLIDVHFALVFKLTGTGTEKFDITKRYIDCEFYGKDAKRFYVPVVNPIYKALEERRLKVYKFDENEDGIYLGTPEIPMNQLKDIVIEIPEKAELVLRVIARFSSDKYDTPIIFQANYNMLVKEEQAQKSRVFWGMEQSNFHWTDYYTGTIKKTLNSPNATKNTAGSIVLLPNFVGLNGFSANATDIYPTRGNTKINKYTFCNSTFRRENEELEDIQQININVYPNPNQGSFIISSDSLQNIYEVKVINTVGEILYSVVELSQPTVNVTLENMVNGIYILQVTMSDGQIYNSRFIVE